MLGRCSLEGGVGWVEAPYGFCDCGPVDFVKHELLPVYRSVHSVEWFGLLHAQIEQADRAKLDIPVLVERSQVVRHLDHWQWFQLSNWVIPAVKFGLHLWVRTASIEAAASLEQFIANLRSSRLLTRFNVNLREVEIGSFVLRHFFWSKFFDLYLGQDCLHHLRNSTRTFPFGNDSTAVIIKCVFHVGHWDWRLIHKKTSWGLHLKLFMGFFKYGSYRQTWGPESWFFGLIDGCKNALRPCTFGGSFLPRLTVAPVNFSMYLFSNILEFLINVWAPSGMQKIYEWL